MEYFQSLYDQFVAIVGEGTCTDHEIKKYIQWGNGNLEVSLNYFFQKQTKQTDSQKKQPSANLKQQNHQKQIQPKANADQKGVTTRSNKQNQEKQQSKESSVDNQNKNYVPSQVRKQLAYNEDSENNNEDEDYQISDQERNDGCEEYLAERKPKVVNAFQKLQEGSKKMREFDKIIESLKEEYKKPVESVVERKLSISKEEYSNDFDMLNSMQQANSNINHQFNVNLDYLPSILRKPTPEEVQQVPSHYVQKYPKIDTQTNEPTQVKEEYNVQINNRVNYKTFKKTTSINRHNDHNQNYPNGTDIYNIKEEQQNDYLEQNINDYKFNKENKSTINQSNVNNTYNNHDNNYDNDNDNENNNNDYNSLENNNNCYNFNSDINNKKQNEQEKQKKKTQDYESFESGIKNLQKGDEQALQFPCYLGQFILTGHALTSSRCDMRKGDDIILKIEKNMIQNGLKNKAKPKKAIVQSNQQMIIRLVWREKEVGRVDNNFAQALYPLIERNYIFVQGVFEYAPVHLQAFSQIKVIVKVSLMRFSITKPITQIIEENSDTKESQILRIYNETKDSFASLFQWLRLEVITPTLITIKSNRSKVDSSLDTKKLSYTPTSQNILDSSTSFSSDKEKTNKSTSKMISEDEEGESNFNGQEQQNYNEEQNQEKQQIQEIEMQQEQQNQEQMCKIEDNILERSKFDQESRRMVPEDESYENNNSVKKEYEGDQNNIDQQGFQNRYSNKENSSALPKININDPFVKLPKQKTLMSFKLQPKKIEDNRDSSFAQNDKIPRNNSNEQVKVNEDKEEKQNQLDFEQLFNITPDSEGAPNELKYSEPPPTFKTVLHNYQKQALTWMLSREGKQTDMNEIIKRDTRTLHPLWEKFALPQSIKYFLYFNPYSGQVSTQFPRAQTDCRGGILADEMGLGKTVMMISLIHSNKKKNHHFIPNAKEDDDELDLTDDLNNFLSLKPTTAQSNQRQITASFKPKQKTQTLVQMARKEAGTLIIVPVTLLSQWIEEITSHSTNNSITYYAYYGSSRNTNLNSYDVVITTYGTISSEFASSSNINNKNLYKFNWHRIVLDEAHYIKGRVIQIAKAVYNLSGDNRWCMSGTPLQNKLDELFPLIHFIKLEPWSDYIWWNNYINKPHEKGETIVYEVLKTILRPILLRRTKKSKDIHGKSIITLPEKYCRIEYVQFTPEERTFYDQVHSTSKEEFDGFLSQGVLLSNYMKVFELLLRLRQICDHLFLIATRGDVTNTDGLEQKIRLFVERRNKALKEQSEQIEKKSTSIYLQNQTNQLELLEGTDSNRQAHFEMILDENNVEQRIEIPDNYNFDYTETYLLKVVEDIKYNNISSCNICLEDMEDAVLTACLHVSCRLCAIRSIEFTGMCPICRKLITKEDIFTVPRNNRFTFDPKKKFLRSSKINAAMTYIQKLQDTDDKCLLFTQFLGMMDLFEIDLQRNNIPYLRLDGSLSQKQRVEVIKKFNEDSQYKVFMISLKAGGVGLNLVRANHVLMVDPWWNPAVEEQAIERCHRIGQKKEVFVTRFICEDSIESRMIKLHEQKRDLFENTIQATKKDKKEQNIEHFKYLMSNY